ncbi:MAG: cytochrome ubiquinol oxidase subunit I [Deltaproteobacteria bacterium]|nr:cytochrome ubiquinol oxidase subunit I [Deltaproteobacteria bacterium]TLN04519.1 MAG: cytochrome ubiquinol oxidase subunit I [bacterium]
MDVVELSRLQFALTGMFHFIFVPLTLGLSVLVAFMEVRYVRTGNELYLAMTKFWGKLFLINFALGVVTGITMEFQFGMNWAEYSRYVGDIFGAPLAIEATVAFFLESVFIGVWIFGWNKVSKKVHALCICIVAFASNLSALWILLANGWMQRPVGYVLRNGRAEMVDFAAMLTNPYGLFKFAHTAVSGYVVAGFFVLGISAWHLLRKNQPEFFKTSFRVGAVFSLLSIFLVILSGDYSAVVVAEAQPVKFAAMESIWETQACAGLNLITFPSAKNECNIVETGTIPKLVSYLAFHNPNAVVRGLKDFPKEDRPPVLPVFLSFRAMVGMGFYMTLLAILAVFVSWRGTIEKNTLLLRILLYSIPIPYLANQFGWLVAEIGRQPWIVYGVLRTSDAVSTSISVAQVTGSVIGFTLLYGFLGFVDIYLLVKYARKGPDGDLSSLTPSAHKEA